MQRVGNGSGVEEGQGQDGGELLKAVCIQLFLHSCYCYIKIFGDECYFYVLMLFLCVFGIV